MSIITLTMMRPFQTRRSPIMRRARQILVKNSAKAPVSKRSKRVLVQVSLCFPLFKKNRMRVKLPENAKNELMKKMVRLVLELQKDLIYKEPETSLLSLAK